MSSQKLRIASAQYDISLLKDWAAFENKIENWVNDAIQHQAHFLVFPEYASMELVSLFDERVQRALDLQLHRMQSLVDDYRALFRQLAMKHQCYIVAGSIPVQQADGEYRNRSHFYHPDGYEDFQDKLQMTRFENEQWHVQSGDRIKVFNTDFGRIGINICYDSEFPLIARRQAESGAHLIVVPSCTDTLAGYYRVRTGCQARALENQCYVIQSPTVGEASWSEAVDINIGAAAVYTPMDYGFPDDGVLSIGELNQKQWVYADLDIQLITEVRRSGQVFNYRDWNGQQRFLKT